MTKVRTVGVGLLGAGFLAETRARCYPRVAGGVAQLKAVYGPTRERALSLADRHGIPRVCETLGELLESDDVEAVDLCVPNHLHRSLAEAVADAGKHVICTKPLAVYFGQDLGAGADDAEISGRDPQTMMAVAVADAQAIVDVTERNGVRLFYGENWVYAPAIVRARKLLRQANATLLEMRGWECHSGSHSPYAKRWRHTGGGALLRLGAHPIGAMLHLKWTEGLARLGRAIEPVAVSAEVADLSRVDPAGQGYLATGWEDVENWGCVVISFDDGSRGIAYGSDNVLGGMDSRLELYASNCRLRCNLSPHDLLQSYAPADGLFGEGELMEKSATQAGWSTPLPSEDWSAGHQAMCADFVGAIAEDRPAAADGQLGLAVTRVVYGAYCAAREGRRVELRSSAG